MSYSSYEKDKKLMESWRKYTASDKKQKLNEEQVQLNVVEEEQIDEVAPAVILAGLWSGLKILAGFMATVVPLVIANRQAIRQASNAILANRNLHPRIHSFAQMCLSVIKPFDKWDQTIQLGMEDAKNPEKLLNALAADLEGQIPDMPQGAPVDSGRTPDWDPSQMDEKNKRRH